MPHDACGFLTHAHTDEMPSQVQSRRQIRCQKRCYTLAFAKGDISLSCFAPVLNHYSLTHHGQCWGSHTHIVRMCITHIFVSRILAIICLAVKKRKSMEHCSTKFRTETDKERIPKQEKMHETCRK